MAGKLYLIPTPISEDEFLETIPGPVAQRVGGIRFFFVEEEKSARRFLKKLNPTMPVDECVFFQLSEHTPVHVAGQYFKTILDQEACILSESGCPCIADPGAEIVLLAHRHNMEVIPLVGPSSIPLALMASGLNGQNFAFNGYLPRQKDKREKRIKELEKRSQSEGQTQILMETPYRNQSVWEDILACCDGETLVCLASDLSGRDQYIKTLSVKKWREMRRSIDKKPALFLLQRLKGR